MPEPKIEISGLHKSFGTKQVLRGVDLSVGDHESLVTESEGEGGRRYVVLYPKNYKPARPPRR